MTGMTGPSYKALPPTSDFHCLYPRNHDNQFCTPLSVQLVKATLNQGRKRNICGGGGGGKVIFPDFFFFFFFFLHEKPIPNIPVEISILVDPKQISVDFKSEKKKERSSAHSP